MEYSIIERNYLNLRNTKMKEMIKQKIKAALILGAKGDALGVPTEMRTYDDIRSKFGRVTKYENAIHNGFFRELGIEDNIKGFWSDDTVLSLAITQSLIDSGKIDYENIIQSQIKAYKEHPWGFGKATRQAFFNIENGISYSDSGIKETSGNGTVMKQFILAPYFLTYNYPEEEIIKSLNTIVRMTHNNSTPVLASIVHNKLLMELLTTTTLNKIELLYNIISYCEFYEKQFSDIEDKLSSRLKKILNYFDNNQELNITDQEIINEFGRKDNNPKTSGFVNITIGVVYCLFFRNPNYEALIDAVNIGGDTDTFAAVIGNMIGAYTGDMGPEELNNDLKDYDKICNIAQMFIDKHLA